MDGVGRDEVDGVSRDEVDGVSRDEVDGVSRDEVDGVGRDEVDGVSRDEVVQVLKQMRGKVSWTFKLCVELIAVSRLKGFEWGFSNVRILEGLGIEHKCCSSF